MDSRELRKLITGFLLLSVVSSTLTLVFLNFNSSAPPSAPVAAGDESAAAPTIGTNAFVEPMPSAPIPADIGQSRAVPVPAQPSDPSNLTQSFADIFARETIAHNPDGPRTDSDGKPVALNLPDETAAAEMIRQALATTSIQIDEQISDSDIKIGGGAQRDFSDYFKKLNGVLADVSRGMKSLGATDQNFAPEALSSSQLIFESAYSKLARVPAPRPLAELHRGLLTLFANQNKIFSIASNYQVDPIKSLLALQAGGQLVDRDIANLQAESQKLQSVSYFSSHKAELSLLEKILGIKTASAQEDISVPTNDKELNLTTILEWAKNVVSWGKELANWVKLFDNDAVKWAYTTALRIAVKLLIDKFQNQVVNWIAGNGNPLFITDWKGFLKDIGDKAAGQALAGVAPFLCSGFGPLIKVAIQPVPRTEDSVRCTLTQIVGNVQDFYNNFQNGGWIAYGATLQPQNNIFGSLIMTSDITQRAVNAAREAAGQQSVASQGFFGTTKETGKCLKSHTEEDCSNAAEGICAVKTVCDEKEKITTTPGNAVGSTLTSALNWPQNEWVTAQRFEELVAAIINAGINRMMKDGLSALTSDKNPTALGTYNPPTSLKDATQLNLNDSSGLSTRKTSLIALVNQLDASGLLLKNVQSTADADRAWLALEPLTVTRLNDVAAACPVKAATATSKAADLEALVPVVQAELALADGATADSLVSLINAATNTAGLDAIDAFLNGLSDTTTTAQGRLASLKALDANAQANLPNKCNVPL